MSKVFMTEVLCDSLLAACFKRPNKMISFFARRKPDYLSCFIKSN